MQDRRLEPRMLCADLIDVEWVDVSGEEHRATANLEDISNSGACLQVDGPIPYGALLRMEHADLKLEGKVRYCAFRETGYFVGIQFDPGSRWTQKQYRPKHLLDPRRLLSQLPKKATQRTAPADQADEA